MTQIFDGLSVHVIRRGNNRGPIFVDDYDRELFLALLETHTRAHAVAVNGLTLMSNHYHAIMTPPDSPRLEHVLRDLGREYVRRYNRRHNRIGTLWAGRPRVLLIRDERYWLTCLRYIEQNPVRANMVTDPADYRWSSFRFHALGEPCDWLTPHHIYIRLGATPEQRQAAYRGMFDEALVDRELVRQRLPI